MHKGSSVKKGLYRESVTASLKTFEFTRVMSKLRGNPIHCKEYVQNRYTKNPFHDTKYVNFLLVYESMRFFSFKFITTCYNLHLIRPFR